MTTLSLSKAARKLPELSRKFAKRKGEAVQITDEGQPTMVIMSVAEYERLKETADVFADGHLLRGLKNSIEDVREGRVVAEKDADALIGW